MMSLGHVTCFDQCDGSRCNGLDEVTSFGQWNRSGYDVHHGPFFLGDQEIYREEGWGDGERERQRASERVFGSNWVKCLRQLTQLPSFTVLRNKMDVIESLLPKVAVRMTWAVLCLEGWRVALPGGILAPWHLRGPRARKWLHPKPSFMGRQALDCSNPIAAFYKCRSSLQFSPLGSNFVSTALF